MDQAPRRRGERRLRDDATHHVGKFRGAERGPCSRGRARPRAVFRAAARCAARATASGADTTPRARPPGTLKTRLRSMSAVKAVSTAPGSTVVTNTFCDLSSSCKALPKDRRYALKRRSGGSRTSMRRDAHERRREHDAAAARFGHVASEAPTKIGIRVHVQGEHRVDVVFYERLHARDAGVREQQAHVEALAGRVEPLRAVSATEVLDDHLRASARVLGFDGLLEAVQRSSASAVQHDVVAALGRLQCELLTDADDAPVTTAQSALAQRTRRSSVSIIIPRWQST